MHTDQKFRAEHAIANALSVLECVEHGEQQLDRLALAVKSYLEGDYKVAADCARVATIGCSAKKRRLDGRNSASLDEIRRLFLATRVRTRAPR
jgi:hypothetical protein